jgi:hypothetical protein
LEEVKESDELGISDIDSNVCAAKFYDYAINLMKRIGTEMLHELLSLLELKLENEDIQMQTLTDLGSDFLICGNI